MDEGLRLEQLRFDTSRDDARRTPGVVHGWASRV
jgi:hypothetical protein